MEAVRQSDLQFRIPYWSAFLSIIPVLIGSWLLLIPFCILLSPRFKYPLITVYFNLAIVLSILMLIITCFCVIAQPMIVKNSGIFGHNTWGMMWMAWDEMTSVEPITFWGFDYLKVDSQKLSSSMLIPLYLNNLEKFIIAVCDRAPASNPLRLVLESRNFKPVKKSKSKKLDIYTLS